ncbi:MAG: SDR family NAD(P)-dependent oxidoreductase [Pseudomonadales bacterium]
MGSLDGKVAIITAAGRGIGRGIALQLAQAGADVVVNSYSADKAEQTAADAKLHGVKALAYPGDITDPEVMLALTAKTLDQFGQIDILVNNVGAGPKDAIEPEDSPLGPTAALWDALYAQNLRPVVLMNEAVLPHMVQRQTGKVINISSIAGRAALSDKLLATLVPPSYSAMKAAVANYTQTLAELMGPNNINVNAICPGIVYTDAWKANAKVAVKVFPEFKGADPEQWFEGIARGDYPHLFDPTPMRRPQTIEDMGNAAVFLASDNAVNITGQCLMVDGGMVKL